MKIWNLAISITNECNLSCKHCYAKSGVKKDNEMTLTEIMELIMQAKKCGTRFITLTGGEPLIHPAIFEIVQCIKEQGIKISIATNGLLLNKNTIQKMRVLGVDRVQISLEGARRETNDYIRGNGSFEYIVNEVIPELLHKGLFVALSFTPTEANFEEVEEFIELALQLKVNTVSFRRYSHMGRAKENALSINNEQNRLMLEKIHRMKKNYRYKGLNISTGDPLFILTNEEKDKYCNERIIAGCTAGIASLAIDAEGYIKYCTRSRLVLGNIKNEQLVDVWNNNSVLYKLRNRNNLKGKCGNCRYKNLCGGCRVDAYENTGDVFGEDLVCFWDDVGR